MRVLLVLLLFCLVLSGCFQSEEQEAAESASAVPSTEDSAGRASVEEGSSSAAVANEVFRNGDFEVQILPAYVTTRDPVQALIRGCAGSVDYRWQIDGEEIAGARNATLKNVDYQRGANISALVSCDGVIVEAVAIVRNSPPEISVVAFADPEVMTGKDILLIPEAQDADGDEIYYRCQWWLDDEELTFETGLRLPGEYVQRGKTIAVTVIPYDDYGEGEPLEGGAFVVPNAPPQFISSPPESFQAQEYVYQVEAVDPDGDDVTYRLEQAPQGMQINPQTGELTWQVTADSGGEHSIEIVAEDPEGMQMRQNYQLHISIQE